jgi:hypothetical protein
MNYEGIFIGGEGGGNQPPVNLDGTMIYKNEWTINTLYNKDEVVVYLEHQYIALRSNINKEPDTNLEDWDLLAYWSNNATVSNYRGTFIQGLVLKQYDSVYDRISNGTYINYSSSNYECTTQPDLITDLHKINNPNSLLPSMFSTPYLFGSLGNSSILNDGARYVGGQPDDGLFTYPFLPNLRTRGWKRTGPTQQGSNFMLDPTSIYAKEGAYKFTAIVSYYFSRVPRDTVTSQTGFSGEFRIEEVPDIIIDRCGLNAPISQPIIPPNQPENYSNLQSTLTGVWDVRFGREYGFKLHNIIFRNRTWTFTVRLSIEFLGSTDPVDLRYNYIALSKLPEFATQLKSVMTILPTPVQEEYVIPYPIINNLVGQSVNVSLVDTPSNEFISSVNYTPKCVKLNGYAQNQTYTLTCSARVGVSYLLGDLLEIRACFQSSADNVNWIDISDRQSIFEDIQNDPGNYDVPNIPLYIQFDGYQPDPQFEQQYVRVALIVVPRQNLASITRIILEANGGVNNDPDLLFNPYNCFFQMYPTPQLSSNIVWNQTFENVYGFDPGYNIAYPRNGNNNLRHYLLPAIFGFLPVVCNNFVYPTNNCQAVNNQPLIYSVPNFLRCEFGPEWCGVVLRSAGTYIVRYQLYITIRSNQLFNTEYSIVFARNNLNGRYEPLYTQRLVVVDNECRQTIQTNISLLNDGDIIYPILIWDNLGVGVTGIRMRPGSEFSIVKQ